MPSSRGIAILLLAAVLAGCASAPPVAAPSIARDENGRIHRSRSVAAAFKATHPCPANGQTRGACPGYTIDHINPLACGGADAPENMQWQTTVAAKSKDRWERKACGWAS